MSPPARRLFGVLPGIGLATGFAGPATARVLLAASTGTRHEIAWPSVVRSDGCDPFGAFR